MGPKMEQGTKQRNRSETNGDLISTTLSDVLLTHKDQPWPCRCPSPTLTEERIDEAVSSSCPTSESTLPELWNGVLTFKGGDGNVKNLDGGMPLGRWGENYELLVDPKNSQKGF
jgi:hypothetical protein